MHSGPYTHAHTHVHVHVCVCADIKVRVRGQSCAGQLPEAFYTRKLKADPLEIQGGNVDQPSDRSRARLQGRRGAGDPVDP